MRTGSGRRASVPGSVRVTIAAAVAIAAAGPGGRARADVLTDVEATAGAGATDNVNVVPGAQARTSATFTTVGGTLRVRYHGARSDHALGYRLTYTRYLLIDNPPDTLSHNVIWTSASELSARWSLAAGANAILTRSSGVDPGDPSAVLPQAGMAGSLLYLSTQAHQSLIFRPDPRNSFQQTLTFDHLSYLESTMNGMPRILPTTTTVTFGLSGNRISGRETYMLEADASDMYTQLDTTAPVDPTARGHTILARVLAGWRHDLSPVWSTTLQAGPSMMVRLDGNGVIAPAAIAMIAYSRLPWTASLTASQTPTANPYLGQATIADQVLAHAAVPLIGSDLIYFGGYGGYIYARVANGSGQLDRAYDQFSAGLTLTAHFRTLPFSAAASYSVISQRGSDVPGSSVPDYARQYVLLNIRGDLAWGPGTAPLFGTPL